MGSQPRWRHTISGWFREDGCALYIVCAPSIDRIAQGKMERGWILVERHVPDFRATFVTGPFPTLDGAKAAYIMLGPLYPGP